METSTQVTLREVLRPLIQLFTNFLGKNSRTWLIEFNRFLRKEKTWNQLSYHSLGNLVKVYCCSNGFSSDDWLSNFSQLERGISDAASEKISGLKQVEITEFVDRTFVLINKDLYNINDETELKLFAMTHGLKPCSLEDACLLRHSLTNNDLDELELQNVIVVGPYYGNTKIKNQLTLNARSSLSGLVHDFVVTDDDKIYSDQLFSRNNIAFAFLEK